LKTIIFYISLFLLSLNLYSQDFKAVQIDGKVTNIKNQSIPFAHILIKNHNRGTVSNYKGEFSFVTFTCDTLEFSSVGYKKARYVIPCNPENKIISINIVLAADTIMLEEAQVFPWNTYKDFKEDFLKMDFVEDDMERAYANLAMTEKQIIFNEENLPPLPSASHRLFMEQNVWNKKYYAGQAQPISIFNVMAWAQFFQALKNGDFKRKPSYKTD